MFVFVVGEIVNIDANCNRVASIFYGHEKVYFVIGENKIEKDYDSALYRARNITDLLLEDYNSHPFTKLFVIYTDLKSGLIGEANNYRILPFHRAQFQDLKDETHALHNVEFYPSLKSILDNIVKSYATGYIYSALIDSFCCEQEARMMAMSNANDNAKGILSELSTEFNRVRQAQITQEITEIAAGAKAKKRKDEAR